MNIIAKLLFVAVFFVAGCDSILGYNPGDGGGNNPPPVDTTEVPDTTSVIRVNAEVEKLLVTPSQGKSLLVSVETETRLPNAVTEITVTNKRGVVKARVTGSQTSDELTLSERIAITSLDDAELTVKVKALKGSTSRTLYPNVVKRVVLLSGQDPQSNERGALWLAGDNGTSQKIFEHTLDNTAVAQTLVLPDGRFMQWDLQPSGCSRVVILNYDGSIHADRGEDCRFVGGVLDPELSPNGERIAYSGTPQNDFALQVFEYDLRTDEIVQMTTNECVFLNSKSCVTGATAPAYDPQTGVLYATSAGSDENGDGVRALVRFTESGGAEKLIEFPWPFGSDVELAGIQDGQAILEFREEGGTFGIQYYDLQQNEIVRKQYVYASELNLAPDGSGVAVCAGATSPCTGVGNQLVFFDRDGGVESRVYITGPIYIYEPRILSH